MKIPTAVFVAVITIFTLVNPAHSFAENTYIPKSPHIYIAGPKGGCYYINKNGKKTYVDRSLCSKK